MNKYTIISDSSCDLRSNDITEKYIDFQTIPLKYTLDGETFIDDEAGNPREIIDKMKKSKQSPKTACPSPEEFAELIKSTKTEYVFVVTISSKLSGTNDSAKLAVDMVTGKKVFIIDSLSTSGGLARLIYKLIELINAGVEFDQICEQVMPIRDANRVRFVLNDLSNLVKSGRMSKVMGVVTSVLPIKLICGDNGEGEVKKIGTALGFKKGVENLSKFPGEKADKDNLVVISHCFNEESAEILKNLITEKHGLTNIKILPMRGITSIIANEKGLAISY